MILLTANQKEIRNALDCHLSEDSDYQGDEARLALLADLAPELAQLALIRAGAEDGMKEIGAQIFVSEDDALTTLVPVDFNQTFDELETLWEEGHVSDSELREVAGQGAFADTIVQALSSGASLEGATLTSVSLSVRFVDGKLIKAGLQDDPQKAGKAPGFFARLFGRDQ